jgi:hypothetical protein
VQGLKSFFYKDEQFWMYLKLRNGKIHKYRIVPKNAADGLWINPYIFHFDNAYTVDSVMFKCSNLSILKKNLTVEWEQIGFEANPNRIQDFFGIKECNSDTLIVNSMNGYEQVSAKNWDGLSKGLILESAFEGTHSYLIKANSFSNAFILQLDSIPFQDLKITADCWIKSPDYKLSNNILMIISVTDKTESVLWYGLQIDGQLIDNKQWNHILSFIHYNHNTANRTSKVYLWNKSTKDAMIDNFTISILKNNNP